MVIKYPTNIDTILTVPKVTDQVSPVVAADHNILVDVVLAVENELGTNPSGAQGTVADRFGVIENTIANNLQATQINILDADGYFVSTNVEGALKELRGDILKESFIASQIGILDADGYFISTDVEGALKELASGSVMIGAAEDGSYTDGLFTDFTPATKIGVAIDRFNEVLSNVVPPAAPSLSSIGYSTAIGPSGNVSFGASNNIATYTNVGTTGGGSALDINGTFTSASGTALRKGIYAAGVAKTGNLADTVVADLGSPNPSYPAKAFGSGDSGTLQLLLNGSVIQSVDLSAFTSGSSLNGNGSGFTLSAATSVQFPNGVQFPSLKYRTGTWTISGTEPGRNGWNFIQVKHIVGATTHSTNFFEWIVDADATATTFSAAALSPPTMTGLRFISGVKYHTAGSAAYTITVNNHHRNTFSTSASGVSHPGASNVSIPSISVNNIAVSQADNQVVSQTSTINVNRILNGSISVNTLIDRTVQSDLTSSTSTQSGLLMDNVDDGYTATEEPFNEELFRVPSNTSLTTTAGYTSTGAGLWDSTISIGGATSGYSDGLLVHNGSLFWPASTSVANSGNFAGIAQGPGGNVNYSGITGTRTYWRYFFFSSATQNFILDIVSSGCSFIAASSALGTNNGNVHVEMLLPNTTKDGSGTVQFKDAVTSYTNDASIGCFAASVGATIPTNWGLTAGSKSTATSGSVVIIRLTVGQGWTGQIDDMSLIGA